MTSRPAATAILLTKLSMECTPREAFENHTGDFDHILSFLSGDKYNGPWSLSSVGRFKLAVHKLLLGIFDHQYDRASVLPFLAACSDLPALSSAHSIAVISPVTRSLMILRCSILI